MRFAMRYFSTRSALHALDNFPSMKVVSVPGYYIKKCLAEVLSVKKTLAVGDWINLQKFCSLPGFGFHAFNTLMAKDSGLPEIRKLVRALESSNALNPVLKAQMMPAFEKYFKDCNDEDQKFILDTYDEVMTQFPVLTPEVANLLLKGLTSTPFWKEKGEHIIAGMKDRVDDAILSTIVKGAFLHGDFKYGWQLMSEAVSFGRNLHPKVYNQIIDCHLSQPREQLLFELMKFLENHSYMLPLKAAEKMSDALENSDNIVARFTHIERSGRCGCCKRKLKKVPLTIEEHEKLLKTVEEAFDLNNKYNTYEKQEVSEFKTFLKICPPYSVVLDGPNLFYRSHPGILAKIVKQLEKRGHKILIIGRYHMKKHNHFLSAFEGHLSYFVKNRTKDDTFTIYAALSSSPDTLIFSNDYFGIYYSQMTGETRQLFRRWQLSTHVLGTGFRSQTLVFPEFSPLCQSSDDGSCIHIPLVSDVNYQAFAPSGWLCVQRVSKEMKKKSSKLWPKKEFELLDNNQVDSFKMYGKQLNENGTLHKKRTFARVDKG